MNLTLAAKPNQRAHDTDRVKRERHEAHIVRGREREPREADRPQNREEQDRACRQDADCDGQGAENASAPRLPGDKLIRRRRR